MNSQIRFLRSVATLFALFFAVSHWAAAQTNCTPLPLDLVSWWAGEGDPSDNMGLNNGLAEGGLAFGPAEVGRGFLFNGVDADLRVAASPSLDVGAINGLTIELWINPSDVNERPLVEWSDGSSYCTHFWISVPLGFGGPAHDR